MVCVGEQTKMLILWDGSDEKPEAQNQKSREVEGSIVPRANTPNIAGFCFANQKRVRVWSTVRICPRESGQLAGAALNPDASV
jgi:hypothetical protein